MHIRKIIAAIIGAGVFAGMVFGLAATAMYCDQVFTKGHTPALCVESSPERALFNLAGWILIFAIPAAAAFIYARSGWPRSKSGKK